LSVAVEVLRLDVPEELLETPVMRPHLIVRIHHLVEKVLRAVAVQHRPYLADFGGRCSKEKALHLTRKPLMDRVGTIQTAMLDQAKLVAV
jgi:hypothetical protein